MIRAPSSYTQGKDAIHIIFYHNQLNIWDSTGPFGLLYYYFICKTKYSNTGYSYCNVTIMFFCLYTGFSYRVHIGTFVEI